MLSNSLVTVAGQDPGLCARTVARGKDLFALPVRAAFVQCRTIDGWVSGSV